MLTVQIDFDELLKVVKQITDDQKRILQAHLAASSTLSPDKPPKQRIAGLGENTIWMSDDFDAPLALVPDES